jgi:hypothetical protein
MCSHGARDEDDEGAHGARRVVVAGWVPLGLLRALPLCPRVRSAPAVAASPSPRARVLIVSQQENGGDCFCQAKRGKDGFFYVPEDEAGPRCRPRGWGRGGVACRQR